MLGHLRVVNLGVLEDASIDPSRRFTVITGETGAGKTLLLGGLRLILGGTADNGIVGPHDDVARAEGLLVSGQSETGAARVVPAEGRSRAYLEGSIVSAATLGEVFGSMIEIVGQHDQLSITRAGNVLDVVDSSLGHDGMTAKAEYVGAWETLQATLDRQRQLGGGGMELSRELDLARYQVTEIDGADLRPDLDHELEAAVSRLRNVEEIRDHLAETVQLAEQVSSSAGEMVARLRKVADLDPSTAGLARDAEGLAAVIAEVGREARVSAEGLDADPARLEDLEGRLTALGELKRKYGRTIGEVLAYRDRTAQRLSELEALISEAEHIDANVAEARSQVEVAADRLRTERKKAADSIAASMQGHLSDLGLGEARVHFDFQPVEPGASGGDHLELHFASDSRLEPGPVANVASGGELSRLVLALRLATRDEETTTLVFDEVDTGIGGRTALAMGRKLAGLADTTQVLCVTHLPQVAAFADTHYVVDRDSHGGASLAKVSGEARVAEITRMLAGQPESSAGRTAAAELLESAAK